MTKIHIFKKYKELKLGIIKNLYKQYIFLHTHNFKIIQLHLMFTEVY